MRVKYRRVINWNWIKYRWQQRHCGHTWGEGDRTGRRACQKCGVWLWFPVTVRCKALP